MHIGHYIAKLTEGTHLKYSYSPVPLPRNTNTWSLLWSSPSIHRRVSHVVFTDRPLHERKVAL